MVEGPERVRQDGVFRVPQTSKASVVRSPRIISRTRTLRHLRTFRRAGSLRYQTRHILERVTDAFYALDQDWVFIYINPEGERVLQRSRSDLLGRSLWDAYPEIAGHTIEAEYRRAMRDGCTTAFDYFFDPLMTLFEVRAYPSRDGLSVYFRDVTQEREAATRLAASEARYRALVEQVPAVIYSEGASRDAPLRYMSPYVEELLGIPPAEFMADRSLWTRSIHPDDLQQVYEIDIAASATNSPFVAEYRLVARDGRIVWVDDAAVPVMDGSGEFLGWQGIARDITLIKNTEHELRYLANHDALTGLANRASLDDRLHDASRPGAVPTTVLFMDLDRFKRVNDAYGHTTGDALLVRAGQLLGATVGAAGEVFRFGGDEFVAVLPDASPESTAALTGQLVAAFEHPLMVGTHEISVGMSIGIATSALAQGSASELLRQAGKALHDAKVQGRGGICIYDPLTDQVNDQVQLFTDLTRAVDRGELRLFYQPIVDPRTGRVITVEALLRWQHPTRGLIAPTEIIPLAEETGLIVPIGYWVIEDVCRQITSWDRDLGAAAPASVNINIAARQLRERAFPERFTAILLQHGITADRICLEVSERTAAEDLDAAITTISALHEMGIELALDDFGAGTVSLAIMQSLQVGAIKIDARFIQRLPNSPRDRTVVAGIARLAHDLGIVVTGEGVETEAHLVAAQQAGCDYVQGYLIATPAPAEAVETWLRMTRPPAHFEPVATLPQ